MLLLSQKADQTSFSARLASKKGFYENENYSKEDSSHIINKLATKFEQYVKLNGQINSDVLSTVSEITDASLLTDTIINHLFLDIKEKQTFLEMINPIERVEKLTIKIDTEIGLLDTERKVRGRVKKQMEKLNVSTT